MVDTEESITWMKKFVILLIVQSIFLIPWFVFAGDLTHQWKSPSFSGAGYSAHVLTIENQEFSRTQALKEKKEAEERQLIRDAANTNQSKFMKNVESRIYAQLSKQGTTISYVKDSDNVALTIVSPDGSSTVITVPIGDFTF
jgi:hypothetical protein